MDPLEIGLLAGAVAFVGAVGGVWAASRIRARRRSAEQATPTLDVGSTSTSDTTAPSDAAAPREAPRLRDRIGGSLGSALAGLFSRDTLGEADWDELEEALLLADVGAGAAEDIIGSLKASARKSPDAAARDLLRAELISVVDPTLDRALHLAKPGSGKAEPIIVVGVNGVGKTTTVGKLARLLGAEGRSVVLGAADTFRAAAADQLATWGARAGVEVVRADKDGADPASVAFQAAQRGVDAGADVVLVDTAGRLQNKQGLMDQLGKVVRVVGKVREPAEVLLVLDATTGQNGLAQARVFAEAAGITGIVLTKLDGSAKGGIVVAVQRELGVPVKFVGLGEGADDLAPFDVEGFVDGLLGN